MFRKNKQLNKYNVFKKINILLFLLSITYIIGYYTRKKSSKKSALKLNKEKIKFPKEIFSFMTYAQELEDFILFCIFYDVKNGFYIDIGANDPNKVSVTKAFYLRGWHGINIEPLPDKYQSLMLDRKRDINLNLGAGRIEGNTSLYLGGPGSTTIKKYLKNQKLKKFINIKIQTMKNICIKYVPKNEEIQFVKIDVEGGERDVLLGYDFENYSPKVFCIESTKPNTMIPLYQLWEGILLKNNYSFAYQYNINRYYINNKEKKLKKRFNTLNILINNYKNNKSKNFIN